MNFLLNFSVKEELQFIEREMYSFIVEVNPLYIIKISAKHLTLKIFKVSDIAGNKGSANVIVEVEDVPNMPPRWTQPFATAAFDEKSEPQKFTVAAIDGDTQIKDQIFYELRFDPVAECKRFNLRSRSFFFTVFFISGNANLQIDRSTGELLITSLDRDDLKQEVFNFRVCFRSLPANSKIKPIIAIVLCRFLLVLVSDKGFWVHEWVIVYRESGEYHFERFER